MSLSCQSLSPDVWYDTPFVVSLIHHHYDLARLFLRPNSVAIQLGGRIAIAVSRSLRVCNRSSLCVIKSTDAIEITLLDGSIPG